MGLDPHTVEQTPPGGSELVGRIIGGRLRVLECIGSGSMGTVYRAHHETLDKDVAIKVLSRLGTRDDIRTKRFVREARTAIRLDHANTVWILDFGEDGDDGLLYLAMEYLEGEDLAQLLARGEKLESERVVKIMTQTLAAVAAAHDHGIIHRDIKPSNIFLTKRRNDEGQLVDFVKVCDFGVAKFLASTRDSLSGTAPGATEVIGTPLYMSPEQAVGDTLDPRTDVYSCAVVLYEMLTGRPPFLGETAMGVMLKHVSEPPAAPSTLVPNIDPDLESVLGWALVKDRDARCPSAREFRNALRELRKRQTGPHGVNSTIPPESSSDIDLQLQAYLQAMTKPGLTDPGLPSDLTPHPNRPATDPRILVADLTSEMTPLPSNMEPSPLPPDSVVSNPPIELKPVEDDASMDDLVAEAVGLTPEIRERQQGPSDPSHGIPGLDRRRMGAEVSDRAQYMWNNYGIIFETYHGGYPFFVRDAKGEVMGPCDYPDVTKIIQIEAARGHIGHVSLCGESQQWISAIDFARLTGQESILESTFERVHEPPPGPFSGTFRKTSLAALFARVTRERPTGRLIFNLSQHVDETRIEIHLVQGRPTFVYSSDASLQIPALLVRRDLLRENLIPKFLQMVIEEEMALEQIVGREANLDMRQYHSIFMRERLCNLFRWSQGVFWLDADNLPARMSPFAHSLMAVLPDVVYRAMSRDTLRSEVQPYLHMAIQRSQRFNHGIAAMQLSSAQKSIVRRFLRSKTLGEAVPSEPKLEKLYYAMAYILLETELFLKPIGLR
ncbi:MAG: serine/threonine-protein kinase [Deltaproteobacteria bacterium]